MRFRFCGDLDCPEWVLAEIYAMSKLTSIKMRLLCSQVLETILGKELDMEKMLQLTSDAKLDEQDTKAVIAALTFILSSAAKYLVNPETLDSELQQLGLPKEHSTALCRGYKDKHVLLQQTFRQRTLRLPHPKSVEWKVDYILNSSGLENVDQQQAQLCFRLKDHTNANIPPLAFTAAPDKFRVLLYELKQAQQMMHSLAS